MGACEGARPLNDRSASKQPRLVKIVSNRLERHVLKRKAGSLQVRGSSLKEELAQQKYSHYEKLPFRSLSFSSLCAPLPAPPVGELASRGLLIGERAGRGARGMHPSFPAD